MAAGAHVGQQAGEGLARIHRVEQQPFAARQQADGLEHGGRGHAVGRTTLAAVHQDVVGRRRGRLARGGAVFAIRPAQQRQGGGRQVARLRLRDLGVGQGGERLHAGCRQARRDHAGGQAGVGAGAAIGHHHPRERHAQGALLLQDLLRAGRIAQRADRRGAAQRRQVDAASRQFQRAHPFQGRRHGVGADRQGVHGGAEQPVEQHVAVFFVIGVGARHHPPQHQLAGHAGAGRGRGGQARMVRLQAAHGHHRVGPLPARLAQQELQLAQLVAAPAQRHVVIALGVQAHAVGRRAQRRLQPGQALDRRRAIEQGVTGKALQGGRQIYGHGRIPGYVESRPAAGCRCRSGRDTGMASRIRQVPRGIDHAWRRDCAESGMNRPRSAPPGAQKAGSPTIFVCNKCCVRGFLIDWLPIPSSRSRAS